jgi:hypothetical protein
MGIFRTKLDDKEVELPNTVPDEGEEAFLKMLFQGDNTIVAAAGNFYFGLMGEAFDEATTLATLIGEPSGSGYSRQGCARSAVGWPTMTLINGRWRIRSAQVTFTGTGAGYGSVRRCFLCSVASGIGKLFAISAPLSAAATVDPTHPLPFTYEFFL